MRSTIFAALALVAFAAAAPSALVRRADPAAAAATPEAPAKHHHFQHIRDILAGLKHKPASASTANDAAKAPAAALVRRADPAPAAAAAAPAAPAKHHRFPYLHWGPKRKPASASTANDAAKAPAAALVRRADAVVTAPAAAPKHPYLHGLAEYLKAKAAQYMTKHAGAPAAPAAPAAAAAAPAAALVRRADAVVTAPAAAPKHPHLHGLTEYLKKKAAEYAAKHGKGKATTAGAAAAPAAPATALVRRADAVATAPAATAPVEAHPHRKAIKEIIKNIGLKYFTEHSKPKTA